MKSPAHNICVAKMPATEHYLNFWNSIVLNTAELSDSIPPFSNA
jgi:hypothetical protein